MYKYLILIIIAMIMNSCTPTDEMNDKINIILAYKDIGNADYKNVVLDLQKINKDNKYFNTISKVLNSLKEDKNYEAEIQLKNLIKNDKTLDGIASEKNLHQRYQPISVLNINKVSITKGMKLYTEGDHLMGTIINIDGATITIKLVDNTIVTEAYNLIMTDKYFFDRKDPAIDKSTIKL